MHVLKLYSYVILIRNKDNNEIIKLRKPPCSPMSMNSVTQKYVNFFGQNKSMTRIIILSKWDATPVFVETNPIYLSYIFHP